MKRKLIILLFTLFPFMLFAQSPDCQWAINAGGQNWDLGNDICTDEAGNVYITGFYTGPATFGSFSLNGFGCFVAKIDNLGNWLWVANTDNSSCVGQQIVTDSSDNIVLTGHFQETAIFGDYSITSNGWIDIFVAKLDEEGNWLWATNAGGISDDIGYDITVDNFGNSYVTGRFNSNASFGSYNLISYGSHDIFVAKLDENGNWMWAKNAGATTDYDVGLSISADDIGNSYITGKFANTAIFGPFSISSNGINHSNVFVAKLDNEGNWIWVKNPLNTVDSRGNAISINSDGSNYVTGNFRGTIDFDDHSIIAVCLTDVFVAKIDDNGNWIWAQSAGGYTWDYVWGNSISLDSFNCTYITGYYDGEVEFGNYILNSNISDSSNVFIAKLNESGNWLWATNSTGQNFDEGFGICTNNTDNVYIIGNFIDEISWGNYNLISFGSRDLFIAKFNSHLSIDDNVIVENTKISNYPNPFNPSTTIEFSVQNNSKIELSILNIKGQEIKQLVRNQLAAGQHSIIWNGDDDYNKPVSSGVYLYKLNVNGKTEAVKKCLLLK